MRARNWVLALVAPIAMALWMSASSSRLRSPRNWRHHGIGQRRCAGEQQP